MAFCDKKWVFTLGRHFATSEQMTFCDPWNGSLGSPHYYSAESLRKALISRFAGVHLMSFQFFHKISDQFFNPV